MTIVDEIISQARASLADNPHRIRDVPLLRALEALEGRAQAMAEVAANLRRAADDLEGLAADPATNRLTGHDFEDQPYSKATTLMVARNYRQSVIDVLRLLAEFDGAKITHRATLRHWAEAA